MATFPFINKKDSRVTKCYGVLDKQYKSGKHDGLDMVCDTNRSIIAISPGKVIRNGYLPETWGEYVVVRQADGKSIVYAHLERRSSQVYLDQNIQEGYALGRMGKTGNSTGYHLHIEIQNKYYTPGDTSDIAEYLGIKNKVGKVEDILQVELVKIKTPEGQELAIEGINIEGVNYVKLRPVLEALGFNVGWENKTVIIEE